MANGLPSHGRDLALIRASGSTARVLNLALSFERHGDTPEFAAQPLFRCQKLNRTLIIKHAIRDHERGLFARPEPHTTKIVIPYSPTELELGGTSVMFGEKKFEQLLRKAVGASVSEEDFAADFELITLLHELPSFDPFLLREQLRRAGHEPAKCFFEISEADVSSMLAFVRAEIEPLIGLAFGAAGRRAAQLSMRLAEKLMTDENAQVLAPLRETLRMQFGEFSEGVFAWKGFLYYKWMLSGFADQHQAFSSRFLSCSVAADNRALKQEVEKVRQNVLRRMDMVTLRGAEAMMAYARAFGAFSNGDATPFRDFLRAAPGEFISLGEALGAVKHIYSFWGFRFPDKAPLKLDAEEAQEILQEFDRMLNDIQLIRSPAPGEMLL